MDGIYLVFVRVKCYENHAKQHLYDRCNQKNLRTSHTAFLVAN